MKSSPLRPLCLPFVAGLLLLPLPAPAATVVLEPAKDASLKEDATGGVANGSGTQLFTGRTGNDGGSAALRALLEFDVAGNLPAGATVSSASLTLELAGSTSTFTPATTSLHPLLAEWSEGPSASAIGDFPAAQSGDATWLHTFYDLVFWGTPGGDFVSTASASQSVLAFGPYTWSSAQMAADVQGWLDDPASNHGWILIGDEASSPSGRRFYSREEGDPMLRPRLTIVYDGGAEPVGAPASVPATLALLCGALAASGAWAWKRGRV